MEKRRASPEFLQRFKGRIHTLKSDKQLHEKLYKPRNVKIDRLRSHNREIVSESTSLVTPSSTEAESKAELVKSPNTQNLYQKLKRNIHFIRDMGLSESSGAGSRRNSINPTPLGSPKRDLKCPKLSTFK